MNTTLEPRRDVGENAFFFDDFEVGQWWVTPARTLSEIELVLFSGLAGDFDPLFFDAEHARSSIFRERVLQAQITFAIAAGLEQRLALKEGSGIAFLQVAFECRNPVYVGDTIRLVQIVTSMRRTSSGDRGVITFAVKLLNQEDEIVQEGRLAIMIRAPHTDAPRQARPCRASTCLPPIGRPPRRWRTAEVGRPVHVGMNAMFFDDFEVGQRWISKRRTITETDILLSCGLSGDYNPVHTDEVFAAKTSFGQRILPGLAGAAIAAGLEGQIGLRDGTLVACLGVDIAFRSPIFIGDTVRVEVCVNSKRETRHEHTGIVEFRTRLTGTDGTVLHEGTSNMMFFTRAVLCAS